MVITLRVAHRDDGFLLLTLRLMQARAGVKASAATGCHSQKGGLVYRHHDGSNGKIPFAIADTMDLQLSVVTSILADKDRLSKKSSEKQG